MWVSSVYLMVWVVMVRKHCIVDPVTDVAEGGETVFPIVDAKQRVAGDGWSECAKRGLSVKAAKGDALMFYSLQVDALHSKLSRTLSHALSVHPILKFCARVFIGF